MSTVLLIVGIIQTIWDTIPILSGFDDFAGVFAFGNVLNDILTFRLFQ